MLFDVGTITISPSIYSNFGYDPEKGFAPVTMVAVSPHALVVNPSVPVNSVEELIAYSKANPIRSISPRPAMAPPSIWLERSFSR